MHLLNILLNLVIIKLAIWWSLSYIFTIFLLDFLYFTTTTSFKLLVYQVSNVFLLLLDLLLD